MAVIPDWLNATFTVRIAYDVAYMSCGWSRDTENQFIAAACEVLDKVIDRALEAARARRREGYTATHHSHAAFLEYRVTSNIYSVVLEYLRFTPESPDPNDGERIGNPIEGFSFEIHGSDKRFDSRMILGAWPRNPNVVINQINPFSFDGGFYASHKIDIEGNGYAGPAMTFSGWPMLANYGRHNAYFDQQDKQNIEFAILPPTIEGIHRESGMYTVGGKKKNVHKASQSILKKALNTRPRRAAPTPAEKRPTKK
jgi:hypothetical protein